MIPSIENRCYISLIILLVKVTCHKLSLRLSERICLHKICNFYNGRQRIHILLHLIRVCVHDWKMFFTET